MFLPVVSNRCDRLAFDFLARAGRMSLGQSLGGKAAEMLNLPFIPRSAVVS
jgi:hypothetical protein